MAMPVLVGINVIFITTEPAAPGQEHGAMQGRKRGPAAIDLALFDRSAVEILWLQAH